MEMNETIQAIAIVKIKENQSKYFLSTDKLQEMLNPIKDKPVAIIPIVGPSRQGKSFILNYMIRFLFDRKNINWIGDGDKALEDFSWKSDIDPQTTGLWLSKPFILRQSNGKEIAVLLMDTLVDLDECFNERDLSTFVGISLLMSSYLIFDLLKDLNKNILISLKSVLENSFLSAKAHHEPNEKPFQNLMFLISDFDDSTQFEYGLSDEKAFLERKLESKDNESGSARVVRQLLEQCFKDVSCFLLHKFGDPIEDNFNEFVDGLDPDIVLKINEFCSDFLKTIDNNSITGGELLEYLETYVQVFNSDELPKLNDLVEATAKAKDLILMNKMKETNLSQLKAIITEKPFLSRRVVCEVFNDCKHETINVFDGLKKSTNQEIIKDLDELLEKHMKSNYHLIFDENERRRNQYIERTLIEYKRGINDYMTTSLVSTFVKSDVLDSISRKYKKRIINEFLQYCGGDDKENHVLRDLKKLNEEMDNLENNFKKENESRIYEAKIKNSRSVEESVEYFKNEMKILIEDNVFLSKQVFKQSEIEIEEKTRNLLTRNCCAGELKFRKTFYFDFEKKLKEIKGDFKVQNKNKCEIVESNTNSLLNTYLNDYNTKMEAILQSSADENEIDKNHDKNKLMAMNGFKESVLFKDHNFLAKYVNQLEEDINKSFDGLKKKKEGLDNLFSAQIVKAMESYIQVMDTEFTIYEVLTDDELADINESARDEAIDLFKRHTIAVTFGFDVEKYLSELKRQLSHKLAKYVKKNKTNRETKQNNMKKLIIDLLYKYEEEIEKYTEEVDNEEEFNRKHGIIEGKIISEFNQKYQTLNQNEVQFYREELKEKISRSFKDANKILKHEIKRKNYLINIVRKYYREEMDRYYRNTSFLTKEKLIKCHESVVKRTINEFKTQSEDMPSEKYEELIQNSVNDIFLKIISDNDMNTPTLPAIGIDLGTTNSCVAFYKPGRRKENTVVVISNELGQNITPSVVSFTSHGKVVGRVAKHELKTINRYNTIYSMKRLIGRNFSDDSVRNDIKLWPFNVIDDGLNKPKIRVNINNRIGSFYPEQVSAQVLKKMKEIAENHLSVKVTKAVITVPAYFNDAQKTATKDAGKLAGLEVLKIINEPTAAALAFQLNKSDDFSSRKILIYDFGGGTFDVAVLNIEKGEIEVMAVNGDNHLGGDDIDNNLVEHCLNEFRSQTGYKVTNSTPEGTVSIIRLLFACEKSKCILSSAKSTNISITNFYQKKDLNINLTRDKFEDLNENIFVKSMDKVAQALVDAGVSHQEIDDIVLVGGTARIPRIKEMLSDQFDGRPLNHSVNPDEAVAVGAAIQAAILNGQQAQGLGCLRACDVAPMSLGIKAKDGNISGKMSVIIPRNSKLPIFYYQTYETTVDYQKTVEIEIFEGEEEMVADNRLLGKFELKGIPSAPKGEQPIEVTFEVNDEGILRVSAKIVKTGNEQVVEIKEHKGRLSYQELDGLIA